MKKRRKKQRKLTEEKKEAIARKEMNLNPGYSATDVDDQGRPWWWNATTVM